MYVVCPGCKVRKYDLQYHEVRENKKRYMYCEECGHMELVTENVVPVSKINRLFQQEIEELEKMEVVIKLGESEIKIKTSRDKISKILAVIM